MTPPPDVGRIPGYDLSPPSEADAVASLNRVFGPERGAEHWAQACRAAGLAPGRVAPGEPLGRAAAALAEQGGPCAALARSITIRIRTHARLAALASATTPGGAR
jgi:hypothetical protein